MSKSSSAVAESATRVRTPFTTLPLTLAGTSRASKHSKVGRKDGRRDAGRRWVNMAAPYEGERGCPNVDGRNRIAYYPHAPADSAFRTTPLDPFTQRQHFWLNRSWDRQPRPTMSNMETRWRHPTSCQPPLPRGRPRHPAAGRRSFMLPGLRLSILAALLGMVWTLATGRAEQSATLSQVIDQQVQAAWEREKVTPAGRADDATFLRRVYLDLVGTIPTCTKRSSSSRTPTPQAAEADRQAARRPALRPHQADVWDLVFFGRNPPNGDATRKRDGFKKWLAEQFAKNVPYDRWVRELLLAEQDGTGAVLRAVPQPAGGADRRPSAASSSARSSSAPAATTIRSRSGRRRTSTAWPASSSASWSSTTAARPTSGSYIIGEKSTGEVLFTGSAKEQKPGQKGEPVKPKFLGGAELDEPPLPKDFKEPDFKGNEDAAEAAVLAQGEAGRVGDGAGQPVLRQGRRQSRLGPVHGPRPGPSGRRPRASKNAPSHPALLEALTEAARRAQVRPEVADPRARQQRDVSARRRRRVDQGRAAAAGSSGPASGRCRPRRCMAAVRDRHRLRRRGRQARRRHRASTSCATSASRPNGQGDFQGSLPEHLFLNNSGAAPAA